MELVPPGNRPPAVVVGESAPWLVSFGILRVLVGMLAMALPFITGLATGALVGILLFVTGIAHMIQAFRAEQWGTGLLGFVEGVLAIAFGFLFFVFPVAAVAALSITAMVFLLFDGIVKVWMSLKMRPLEGWGWALFSGIVSLVLGVWLLSLLPVSAAFTVGLLVAANMIVGGLWTLAVGIAALKPTPRVRA